MPPQGPSARTLHAILVKAPSTSDVATNHPTISYLHYWAPTYLTSEVGNVERNLMQNPVTLEYQVSNFEQGPRHDTRPQVYPDLGAWLREVKSRNLWGRAYRRHQMDLDHRRGRPVIHNWRTEDVHGPDFWSRSLAEALLSLYCVITTYSSHRTGASNNNSSHTPSALSLGLESRACTIECR